MIQKIRIIKTLLPGLALAFALLLLLTVSPVHAQSEQPPDEPTPVTQEESAVSSEELSSENSEEILSENETEPSIAPILEGEEGEEPTETEDPALIPSDPEPLALDTVINELADSDLTLINGDGETLDLASQESVEILSGADPYWTVGTTKYAVVKNMAFCPSGTTFGLTCWVDANPIFFALGQISTPGLFPTDGFLYVEGDTYNESIAITGGALATLKGIIGVDGSSATILNGNVNVSNTIAGFTLQGFTINGRILFNNNIGTLNLTDLDVNFTTSALAPISVTNHNGEINVKQVKSSGNRGSNYFDNTVGTGNITVINSAFDHNNPSSAGLYAHGLYINTNGSISLDGVSASNNNGSGLFVLQGANLTIRNSVFNNNYGTPDNGGAGYGITAPMNGNITISQTITNNNERSGMVLSSAANVTLTDVTAYSNGESGVFLNSTPGTGMVKISYSDFNSNLNTGLIIDAKGAVTLTSVKASNNTWGGVDIDNCQWNGSTCTGSGIVTITSIASKGELFANQFNENGWFGIEVNSKSNILLENFEANGNLSGSGVNLENDNGTGNVTVKATLPNWLNRTLLNTSSGVDITSKGNVSVDKVLSENNVGIGIRINNQLAASLKTVTVSNTTVDNNGSHGLQVYSRGLITLMNVDIYDQSSASSYGAFLENTGNNGTGGVTVKASPGRTNTFKNNFSDGLQIQTIGKISISDSQFLNNGTYGLRILVQPTSAQPSVSLLRVLADGNIANNGIQINAYGPVSLTNVTVTNHSNSEGALISNTASTGSPGVTVKDSVFNNNKFYGLSINSNGNVVITTIEASHNLGNGLYVENAYWTGSEYAGGSTTLTAAKGKENTFLWNSSSGLIISSFKNISITNIRSEYNNYEGADITNNYTGSTGTVTIKALSGQFNNLNYNGQDGTGRGIIVNSLGSITAGRIMAQYNNGAGGSFSNSGAITAKSILITDSVFSNNQGDGVTAYSLGSITLKGVDASDNSKFNSTINISQTANDFLSSNHGQDIWKFSGTNGAAVNIILQSAYFDTFIELRDANWGLLASDDNNYGGTNAQIITNLPATGDFYLVVSSVIEGGNGVYRLSLNDSGQSNNAYNYFYGAILDNSSGDAGISILPSSSGIGGTFRQNNYFGISLNTKGAVTLSKIWAEENGSSGLQGGNSTGVNKSFSIIGSHFNNNDSYGISLSTSGNFSWNGGSANGNYYNGLYLNGTGGTIANTATISNVIFSENDGIGFQVYVFGHINLNTVSASNNTDSGGVLDNCQWNGSSCDGTGNITFNSATANSFNDNGYYGTIMSTGGVVKITNISANRNINTGVYINASSGFGNVTVQNPATNVLNTISQNGYYGIEISANGLITVNKITAENNDSTNIYLYTTSTAGNSVTLTNSKANGSINNMGFYIDAGGGVTLKTVSATNNFNRGGYIDNGANLNALVTTSIFTDNGFYGLEVNSNGNVTLNGITASGNNDVGVRINNNTGTGKVELLSTLGENLINNNTLHGLQITTAGNVTLSKVTAVDNGFSGIYVTSSGGTGIVSLNTVLAKNNGHTGIYVFTTGKVTITKATSLNNGQSNNGDGLYANTSSSDGVTISSSYFIGNAGSGIELNVVDPLTMVFISNTAYLGNDSDNSIDLDLNVY